MLFSAEKKNTAYAVQAKDFVGVKQRQNESGVLRGSTFFPGIHPLKVVVITVSTTTFSRIWNKGYHGSMGASRWFCKIYYCKATELRLIYLLLKTAFVSHEINLYLHAEMAYPKSWNPLYHGQQK